MFCFDFNRWTIAPRATVLFLTHVILSKSHVRSNFKGVGIDFSWSFGQASPLASLVPRSCGLRPLVPSPDFYYSMPRRKKAKGKGQRIKAKSACYAGYRLAECEFEDQNLQWLYLSDSIYLVFWSSREAKYSIYGFFFDHSKQTEINRYKLQQMHVVSQRVNNYSKCIRYSYLFELYRLSACAVSQTFKHQKQRMTEILNQHEHVKQQTAGLEVRHIILRSDACKNCIISLIFTKVLKIRCFEGKMDCYSAACSIGKFSCETISAVSRLMLNLLANFPFL